MSGLQLPSKMKIKATPASDVFHYGVIIADENFGIFRHMIFKYRGKQYVIVKRYGKVHKFYSLDR